MGLDQYADGLNKEFYWRKHARLQVFMAREYDKQNPKEEKAIKNGYWDCFAHDGFFWGQQFQEESVKQYKELDKEFLKAARKALKAGREVTYNCSW